VFRLWNRTPSRGWLAEFQGRSFPTVWGDGSVASRPKRVSPIAARANDQQQHTLITDWQNAGFGPARTSQSAPGGGMS